MIRKAENPNSLCTLPISSNKNMTIALVGPELEDNLSLRYLASSLGAAGYPSSIIPFNSDAEMKNVLRELLNMSPRPMMVALSLSFQYRAIDFLGLAVALREQGYEGHITAGGHFGTFACEEILRDFPEIDTICVHEAEVTIARLAATVHYNIPINTINGVAYRKPSGAVNVFPIDRPPELSVLAWPDRRGSVSSYLGHKTTTLVSSRGCYANCTFCCISAWHRKATSGKPFRPRPLDDVADEMVWLNKNQDIQVFVFHDDNFFLPNKTKSLEKMHSLADTLEARGMGPFSIVVKARPNDLTDEILEVMQKRLGLIRLFLGVETASLQGLKTLRRHIVPEQNHQALRLIEEREIYVCFNMLIFDPDTTVESLMPNIDFMEKYAHIPFNFGRVELYAGTPLLARMLKENRVEGNYLKWDYKLADPQIQHIFQLTLKCFYVRNFSETAMANRLMGTRFDVDVCKYFHPEAYEESWMDEMKNLSRELSLDSVRGMKEIIAHAKGGDSGRDDTFVSALSQRLRRVEEECSETASDLEKRIKEKVEKSCRHARVRESAHV